MILACPVTRGYLNAVGSLYDLSLVQYEMWLGPFEDAMDFAAHAGGSRQLQHQRAFYCVELMTSRFQVQSIQPPWPRSREGLNQVLSVANELRDDILAEVTEHAYLAVVHDGVVEQHIDLQRAISELLRLVCESSELLRQSLKNPEIPLSRVGKRLALAANGAGYYIDGMLALAMELINHNNEDMRRAWERHKT